MSIKVGRQKHRYLGLNQLGVTMAPPDSCYYPALKVEEQEKSQGSGWEEQCRQSAVVGLTNELANGALAFFTVTGEMWHHKITSNPRLTRAVTAASNCYLSHLGSQTQTGHSSSVLFLRWEKKLYG